MSAGKSPAQPRNSAGNSFAQTSFLLPLPDSSRRLPRTSRICPGFDNDCPKFWWGERPREPRCPETKTFHPDYVNVCPDIDSGCPGFQNSCLGRMSRCPEGFRLCPDFQTLAPFVKPVAPIFRRLRSFCNLLPQSHLCSSRCEEAPTNFRFPISDFRFFSLSLVTSAATTFNLQPAITN
jgi:hypothetical protein